MQDYKHITIIGLGLIGGSICRAVRRKCPSTTLVGVDRPQVLQLAHRERVIDRGYQPEELAQACAGADLIVIATPITAAMTLLETLPPVLSHPTLVTDVCSLKSDIMALAQRTFTQTPAVFIGGHPMAGSEKPGLQHADPFLFENAMYVLTTLPNTPERAVHNLGNFLHTLGAHVVLMDAETHDRIAAAVSHLPQILAVTLMNYVADKNEKNPMVLKMAAGGFRDMTRIASSPYEIWKDIIRGNRRRILDEIDGLLSALHQMRDKIATQDLADEFQRAARHRLSIPKDTRGFLHAHYDISVEVEDRPGIIATIATALAEADINIKDIEVLKVRENEGGTLRLAFESHEVRRRAIERLQQRGFTCHEREH